MTGDVAWTSASFDGSGNVTGTSTLATVYSDSASVGSSTDIPVLTIDAKGRVTAATTATIATSLTIQSDDAADNTVALATDKLKLLGGLNITSSNTADDVTFAMDTTLTGMTAATFSGQVQAGTLVGALTGNVTGDVTGDLTGDSAGTHTGE